MTLIKPLSLVMISLLSIGIAHANTDGDIISGEVIVPTQTDDTVINSIEQGVSVQQYTIWTNTLVVSMSRYGHKT